MMLKPKPILLILIIIALLVAIVFVLLTMFECLPGQKSAPAEEQKELPEEVYGFSGTIVSIEENVIVIDATIIFADGDTGTEQKRILIDENTPITKLEFPEITPENRDQPIIPEETQIQISDLQTGDKIDVRASENISGKTEFTAESINVVD